MTQRHRRGGSSTPASLLVLVCRDCCCGTTAKHPEVDHRAQLDAIESAVESFPGGRAVVTRCLDACSRSNVVVVRWREGGEPRSLWLGGILRPRQERLLCDWLARGGPLSAPLPTGLAFLAFAPTRENACAADAASP
jgi:hypothetical protein